MPSASDKLWQEWSHKILEELITLNNRYEHLAQEIDEKYDLLHQGLQERYGHIEKKLERINDMLTGGSEPGKGLIVRVDRIEQKNIEDLDVRVDRLEQSDGRRTWLQRTTIVACIGAIVAQIFSWVFQK